MIKQENCYVVEQYELADSIYKLTLQGELVKEVIAPGQFVHVKVSDGVNPLLRRPISISEIHPAKKQFTLIYRKQGKGTDVLSKKIPGATVDILGPLGNGFTVESIKPGETALLVGGGIGVPPLLELSKQLNQMGVKVIHVLGFQSVNVVFAENEFVRLGETYIVTVDGSYGSKGFVTDVIKKNNLDFSTMYACGPTPMLRALETEFPNKKIYLSLEERMGCGIGACFACVCHTAGDPTGYSYKKVCSDGPVFLAGEVVL
jgi:dihydroorotate dehydrogenase electron transfer subunit